MKAVVAAFNQEKALVGAFSVITNLRMELFEALEDVLGGQEAGIEEQPAHERGLVRLVDHQDAVLDVLLHQEGVHVPAVVVIVVLV